MLILISVIIGVIFLVGWLVMTGYYFTAAKLNGPKIKFKSFIQFYVINPDRWNLYDDYVECKIQKMEPNSRELFHFGYLDWFRYLLWMHNTSKREQKIENAKATAQMLSMVKKDIEINEQKARAAVNKGVNDLQYILKNERNNKP